VVGARHPLRLPRQDLRLLLGELVRRATGRGLSWWLRETLTVPLGIGDEVHFGVPGELLDRVARQQPPAGPPPPPPEPGSPLDRALPPGIRPDAGYANRRDVLAADIPSEGTMTARGAARLCAALLGHVDGVELVSPARRAAMAAVQFQGQEEVMGFPSTWAFGFSPQRLGGVPSRPGSTFGMVGMNGSAAWADIDTGVAVAVLRDRFDSDLALVGEVDRLVAVACVPPVTT
jgi:CubicO group peptidase (beta-lactamase class C family)